MRLVADAGRLPLRSGSVDAIIGNPPYPGNSIWRDGYMAHLDAVLAECRRVLRPGGRGWFLLLYQPETERWMSFDSDGARWAHEGRSEPAEVYRPGIHWGTVPDAEVVPLILGCTAPDDTVLDPFAGRGGIPKLAARLGRVPLGADIDIGQLEEGRSYRWPRTARPVAAPTPRP